MYILIDVILVNQTPAISFNRAALKVGARDCYIGWEESLKQQNLHRVVCNNRSLILPWVSVKNLASHLLSRTLRLLRKDWFSLYSVSPFLVETFVDSTRYLGTCYKAAGWQELGETRGFKKAGKKYVYHGNLMKYDIILSGIGQHIFLIEKER